MGTKIFRINKIYSFKDNLKFDFDPGPKFNPKFVFKFFKIFDRNDIRFEVGHVWTMRGPSSANVKDKRVRKERPLIGPWKQIQADNCGIQFTFWIKATKIDLAVLQHLSMSPLDVVSKIID